MTLFLPRGGVGVQLSSKRSEICDWLLPRYVSANQTSYTWSVYYIPTPTIYVDRSKSKYLNELSTNLCSSIRHSSKLIIRQKLDNSNYSSLQLIGVSC